MKPTKVEGTLSIFSISVVILVACMFAANASAEVSVPPFYEAVAKMAPSAQAWLIAYISSDIANRKTIATGLVVAPTGKAPKEGRPVVAWAHGTTGTAQNCGPSQILNPAVPLNEYFLVGGNSWTDYGLPAVSEFIKAGYIVVGTDYQGLGLSPHNLVSF